MSGIFRKPKVELPEVKPPEPIPELDEETEEQRMKKLMKRTGFTKSILTGDLSPSTTGKKTLLG